LAAGLEPNAGAHTVVCFQELLRIPDVHPLALEPVAVNRNAGVKPAGEMSRLVQRIPLLEVLRQEGSMLGAVEVDGDADEVALRLLGLLDERYDAIVGVDFDDAVLLHLFPVGKFVERQTTALSLPAPEFGVVGEREVEEIVAGGDEQILSFERGLLDRELNVPDRAQPVLVGLGAIVVYRYGQPALTARGPPREIRREA